MAWAKKIGKSWNSWGQQLFMACYAMFQSSSFQTAGILFSVAASLDAKLLQDAATTSQLQPNLLAKKCENTMP
jgi:hypothetical protein